MSPRAKRIKLESPSPEPLSPANHTQEDDEDHCSICLQPVVDRALIPICSHEFCFECLTVWAEQSRRCPLCSQGIGEYVIHHIRSKFDYQKYFLTPLRTSPRPLQPLAVSQSIANRRPTRREREWGRRERQQRDEADQLERSISHRRWVYAHHLYAKHVASNSFTRYRPFPTPAQFSASPDFISRTTAFVRRELQVWPNLDVEFLTTFIVSIMKSIDIRAESAVKLLSEFLDMDEPYVEGKRHPNAEHFAHEMYSFLRSPYRDLYIYDTVVQYDAPADVHPPSTEFKRSRRWRDASASRSRSRSLSSHPYTSHKQAQRSPDRPQKSSSRRRPRSRSQSRRESPNERLLDHGRDANEPRNVNEVKKRGQSATRDFGDLSISGYELRDHDDLGRKWKGKGRALGADIQSNGMDVDGVASAPKGGASNSAEINELIEETTTKPTREREMGPIRGGRSRTLLESVQSHLSLPQVRTLKEPTTNAQQGSSSTSPSLLTQLSEPQTQSVASPMEPIDKDKVSTVNVMEVNRQSMSAPDIMKRTRTRLAKLKNETIAGIPPSAPTPPILTTPPPTDAQIPLHSTLLEKLQAEKNMASEAPLEPLAPTVDTGSAGNEALQAESRLRKQAQLRVRLAAAKRKSITEDSEREDVLRATLRNDRLGHER